MLPEMIKLLVYMRSSAGESELGTERNDYEDNETMSKLAELWRERTEETSRCSSKGAHGFLNVNRGQVLANSGGGEYHGRGAVLRRASLACSIAAAL